MKVPQYIYGTNDELQRYFALLLQQMQVALSDNGWTVPSLIQLQVDQLISGGVGPLAAFSPVMPAGTQWFNATIKKMQFITDQAIPPNQIGGPLDAIIETITSV